MSRAIDAKPDPITVMHRLVNELVASWVFGWKPCFAWNSSADGKPVHFLRSPESFTTGETTWKIETIPAFSTDARAAWEVVDKMRANGWRLSVLDYGDNWVVVFTREAGLIPKDARSNPHFPLAVSLAALYALGATEEEVTQALKGASDE